MAANKTTFTNANVTDFINSYVEKEQKRADSFRLIELMQKWSGFEPKMYGPTIVGFGKYHYKYASGHEGDAPLLGFAPRKAEFVLYVVAPDNEKENDKYTDKLGKIKMSKGCIYFKKLEDIDLKVLEGLCKMSMKYTKAKYK